MTLHTFSLFVKLRLVRLAWVAILRVRWDDSYCILHTVSGPIINSQLFLVGLLFLMMNSVTLTSFSCLICHSPVELDQKEKEKTMEEGMWSSRHSTLDCCWLNCFLFSQNDWVTMSRDGQREGLGKLSNVHPPSPCGWGCLKTWWWCRNGEN